MTKVAIFGPQGSGKTTIAMFFIRAFMQQDKTLKVYTNVYNLANTPNFIQIDDLSQIPFQDGLPKIIYVDEAYFTIGSRDTGSKQNKIWTKAFALFRKSDVVCTIFSTHRPNMIDINIRNLCDYIIMSKKNRQYNDYLIYEVISKMSTGFTMPKTKALYDFTKFDTKDFPPPISSEGLEFHPLFKVLK